ncbi:hypothetical protein WAI453_009290 [Rhynchosporium graminicola]
MTAPNQLHTISLYQRGTQSEKKIQVMSTETNYAAIVEAPYARLTTVTRPIPVPGDKELVVRNHAIAVNPADVSPSQFNFTAGVAFSRPCKFTSGKRATATPRILTY